MRYLLILLMFTGCVSAKRHLQLSEKHRLLAISKGAVITPDTVHITKTITIEVPAKESDSGVKPEIDSTGFQEAINKNDSLVAAIKAQEKAISEGAVLDKEKAMYRLNKANAELRALRKRLAAGFSVDSVYVVHPDSLTTISVSIKDGLLDSIKFQQKAFAVKKTIDIPLWVEQAVSAGFQKWHLIGGGALVLIIGFILGLALRTGKE